MHKGTITYHFSDNLGDYIQTLAASKLLGAGPYTHCDREQLHTYQGPEVALLMNGWFMANPKHWPPAPGIRPLLLSMHVNPTAAAGMLSGKGLEYFKKHGPVGCRDHYTLRLLQQKGISAYFSGCLTLTLQRSDWVPKNTPRKGILVLSALDRLLPNRKALWQQKKFVQWGIQTLKYPFKLRQAQKAQNHLQHFLAKQSKPISYASQIVPTPLEDNAAYFEAASEQLKKIASAELVITSRIHTALPAVALGTPVVFLADGLQHPNQMSRLEGLTDLFPVCTAQNLDTPAIEALQPTQKYRAIAGDIRETVAAFLKSF